MQTKWVQFLDWIQQSEENRQKYIGYVPDVSKITFDWRYTKLPKEQKFATELDLGWHGFASENEGQTNGYLIAANATKSQMKLNGCSDQEKLEECFNSYYEKLYSNKFIGAVGLEYKDVPGDLMTTERDFFIPSIVNNIDYRFNSYFIEYIHSGKKGKMKTLMSITPEGRSDFRRMSRGGFVSFDTCSQVLCGMRPKVRLPDNVFINISDENRNGMTPETAMQMAIMTRGGEIRVFNG